LKPSLSAWPRQMRSKAVSKLSRTVSTSTSSRPVSISKSWMWTRVSPTCIA
jgi:hypothetical protein